MTAETPIEALRNIGPTSAEWLRGVGIHTRAKLERLGPAVAYQMVRQRQHYASLNLLWALAAALTDKDCRELTGDEKRRLRAELAGL